MYCLKCLRTLEIYALIVILWYPGFVFGDDLTKSFLSLSPDAISQSVGGANPAFAVGAVDVFTNPALLSLHRQKSIQFSNMINSRNYHFSSVAFEMSLSNRSFAGVGLKGQLNQEAPQSKRNNVSITLIEPSQFALYLAFAHKFNALSFGITLQYYQIQYQRGDVNLSGKLALVNFGGYYAINSNIQVGLTVKTPIRMQEKLLKTTPAEKYSFGVLWLPAIGKQFPFKIVLGVNRMNESPLKLNGGLIFTPMANTVTESMFSFRAGVGELGVNLQTAPDKRIHSFENTTFFTIGAGFGFNTGESWGINLDYCYQVKEYISNQHIITTRIRF